MSTLYTVSAEAPASYVPVTGLESDPPDPMPSAAYTVPAPASIMLNVIAPIIFFFISHPSSLFYLISTVTVPTLVKSVTDSSNSPESVNVDVTESA